MAYGIAGMEVSEGNLGPCYLFFGEERFLALEFVKKVESLMISPETGQANIERLNLEDHSWAHIVDTARTMPFLFSSRRLIVVELSGRQDANLNPSEEKELKRYLSSPASQTVLVIILAGKVNRKIPLVSFFSKFPSSVVCIKEMRSLRGGYLFSWIENRFHSLGKAATSEAQKRLVEIIGTDLGRLDSEITKIDTFLDDKKRVDVDDVNEVSGWFKIFAEWEMAESMEHADCEQCFRVLDNLFKEGTRPEYVLGLFARFFRDVLMAKLWLKEKAKDKKEIFRGLRPQIQEKFGSFYTTKFSRFFDLVETMNRHDLDRFLEELQKIDLKFKTSDLSLQTLLEGFLWNYCRIQKGRKKAMEKTPPHA